MSYICFYVSILTVWIAFAICSRLKTIDLRHIFIGAVSAVYSLTFDILFGEYFSLYHYISPEISAIYILMAGILLYPVLNIIYILFLPAKTKPGLIYTTIWIAAMLFYEYISLKTETIFFTGWEPVPWSIITYIFTYLWLNVLYKYLNAKYSRKGVK